MEENKNKTKISLKIEDIIFYLTLVPLIVISCLIIWQRFFEPKKIPDVFGFKMFVVLDDKMDENIKYGDLVFTKNINPNSLKNGDLVAFRENSNNVVIHRIIDISEDNNFKTFTMQTQINEVGNTKHVIEDHIEGIVINKISKIGLVIKYMQNTYVLIILICIVLIVGLIIYYLAQELDKKDMAKTN